MKHSCPWILAADSIANDLQYRNNGRTNWQSVNLNGKRIEWIKTGMWRTAEKKRIIPWLIWPPHPHLTCPAPPRRLVEATTGGSVLEAELRWIKKTKWWNKMSFIDVLNACLRSANTTDGKYYETAAALCLSSPVGHGQSEGERMNIKDFQIYIRDSLQHIDLMKSRHPDLPVFIVGHSMVRPCLFTHWCLLTFTGFQCVLFCWVCCSWCLFLFKGQGFDPLKFCESVGFFWLLTQTNNK